MKIFGGFFIEKDVDFISESVYKDNVRNEAMLHCSLKIWNKTE